MKPIIWADGVHDDGPGMLALARGEEFEIADVPRQGTITRLPTGYRFEGCRFKISPAYWDQWLKLCALREETMNRITNWTEELDNLILSMRGDGISALRIGRLLSMTKGQVIGRLYRLDRQAQGLEREKKHAKPMTKPLGQPAPLLSLDPDGCKWAVAEDALHTHIFCNKHRLDGYSYCLDHIKAARGIK